MTTIHTRQLQQYTQLTTIHTRHLKIQHVQKVNNTKVRKKIWRVAANISKKQGRRVDKG